MVCLSIEADKHAKKAREHPRCQDIRRDIVNMQSERNKLIEEQRSLFRERSKIETRLREIAAEGAITMLDTALNGGDAGTLFEIRLRESERRRLHSRLAEIESEIADVQRRINRKDSDIVRMSQGLAQYGCDRH